MKRARKYANAVRLVLLAASGLSCAVIWLVPRLMRPVLPPDEREALDRLLGQYTGHALFLTAVFPFVVVVLWTSYESAMEEVPLGGRRAVLQQMQSAVTSAIALFLIWLTSLWEIVPLTFVLLLTLGLLLASIGVSAIRNRISIVRLHYGAHVGSGAAMAGIVFLVAALFAVLYAFAYAAR